MKKIHLKIMALAAACLLLAGLAVGFTAILQIRNLEESNIELLDSSLHEDFDRLIKGQVETAMSVAGQIYGSREQDGCETGRGGCPPQPCGQ